MHDVVALLPLLIPAVGSLLLLLVAAWDPDDRTVAPLVAILAAGGSIAALVLGPAGSGTPLLGGMLVMDGYTLFFVLLIMSLLAGAIAVGAAGWRARDYAHGEYWALLLFAACGMTLLVASTNLLLLFIGLEVMSISIYALVGSDRGRPRPPEAALKYFLLGAFSSAFLLFGIAFVYGASGSFELGQIFRTALNGTWGGAPRAELFLGISMMLVGFGFKTSTAPFHMWTPDAYSGAPSPVTGFMASAVKAASFGAFLRVFALALGPARGFWSDMIAVAAALTIVVGNFA
ncbi:MAG TPA: NADH-quinone oxidoreductase subunit N, partial [bacterium]|nr:NADH-quinone oxidoreductase subunit N [bacterium]